MSLYFVEKKCVEAIFVELVAAPKWPHNFLICYKGVAICHGPWPTAAHITATSLLDATLHEILAKSV
jgi:hypothetical protein